MTFSLIKSGRAGYFAVDWSWKINGEWGESDQEFYEVSWHFRGPLTEFGRQILLERFGLKRFAKYFPLEILRKMSPGSLMQVRRRREQLYRLPRIEVVSDTGGYHVAAEMHDVLAA